VSTEAGEVQNIGRDNFEFEGSEDQKNFAAWRGESVEGEQK